MIAFAVLCGMIIAAATHLLGILTMAAVLRCRPERAQLFGGPSVLGATIGGVDCRLGLIPLWGFVKFDETAFKAAGRLRRIVILSGGCAALVLISVIATAAHPHPGRALAAVIQGTLHPRGVGAETLRHYRALFTAAPITAVGYWSIASAIVNAAPIPGQNGGQILAELIPRRVKPAWFDTAWGWIGVLAIVALGSSWLVALGAA